MDEDLDFTEPSITARERALQEKIIRLEKKLEGYQTQIDIIDSQRQQLEERIIRMESALAKAKNGLLEARKELMDKEIAEKELVEKLNSMTQQAEEYKNRFKAERNKNKYSIETLEALLSTVEAQISPRKEFQGFLNEIVTEVKEGFYAQLKVVLNKLTEAESRFHRSPQEMNQCKTILTTSCSATQCGICFKGEMSTATSSSPTHVQYGVFGTAITTTVTSNPPIPFGIFGTAATTTATSTSPISFGKIGTTATTTATRNSSTQYGMFDTAATTTATSNSQIPFGKIGTTATTTATSNSPTQHGMFDTATTTTATCNLPIPFGKIGATATTKPTSNLPIPFGIFGTAATTTATNNSPISFGKFGTIATTTATGNSPISFGIFGTAATTIATSSNSPISFGKICTAATTTATSTSPIPFGKIGTTATTAAPTNPPIPFGKIGTTAITTATSRPTTQYGMFGTAATPTATSNSSIPFGKIGTTATTTATSNPTTQFGMFGTVATTTYTATSNSPISFGKIGTIATTTTTGHSQIRFGKFGTTAITSSTSNAPTQYGMFGAEAITTITSNSSTQYGKSGTGAKPKASSSWPTQYEMIGTAATTWATSSSSTQHRMLGTAETTTVTSSSPSQYGMIGRAVTTTFSAMPPTQSSQTQVPFKLCQKMTTKDNLREQETTAIGTSKKSYDQMAKFALKPGSWKLSDGATTALEVPKTGFNLVNQTTTSSAPNTVSDILRGNTSSGSPFTFGKSDTGPVKSSPFKFGISDSGPSNSSPFSFGSGNSGPVKSSLFTFATSDSRTTKSSTSTFVTTDAGTVNSSPFTFAKSDAGTINTSPFRFDVSPLAPDHTSTTEKAIVTASQVVGGSTQLPSTSRPPTTQPVVLAAFGVPAIASKTNTASFTFGSSSLTGSSPLSVSLPKKAVSQNTSYTVEKSVFGGSTPEQGGAALSFGSFNTDTSPSFDLDLPPHSTFRTQPDPFVPEKFGDVNQVMPNVSQEAYVIQNQSQPSFAFVTPTDRHDVPEEKLPKQPSGTFQFGQLDAYAPLGGATSWTAGVNPCHQATQHSSKSKISQIQSAQLTSEMFVQPLTLSDFSGSELLRRLTAAKEQQDYSDQESQVEGYNFTPYVVYEPAEEASLQRVTKPISTVIVEECDDSDDEAAIEESEGSTDENLSYTSTEGEEDNEVNEDSIASSSPMPPIQSLQTQPPFSPSQRKPLTSPLKPVPIHSTLAENAGPAKLPPHVTGILTPKSALKATEKQGEDCLIVYEVRTSLTIREKASRLFLPLNFFNYTKQEVCPGCLGCRRAARESTTLSKKENEQSTVSPSEENIGKPEESESGNASHVFGQSLIVGKLRFPSVKPKESGVEDAKVSLTSTNTSVIESVEPNTFQDFNKDSSSAGSIFPSPGVKGLTSSQLFTVGRGESNEGKLEDEVYLSPSKTPSPSKQGVTPQAPSTPLFLENVVTSLPFGTNSPAKSTFSLQVSPESPSRKPKSPSSPESPLSTESPGHAEDDGPHFEPVIPLPEKVECRTGEEGHEVMFCERCKLFRYDSDASQWKERGVGDIKILLNSSSGRYRVLMRREHVFKLCANHMISVDMELRPFPTSDRAWLWTTLADFSDEVAAAETLGAKFKTSQVAAGFKDTFDWALQSLKFEAENIVSSGKPDVKETDQENGTKLEHDISVVFERRVTDDQKERAKRLELPSNFYAFEDSASGTDTRESEPVANEQSKPNADVAEEISTPSKFLFGSSSVASLSFQSVAASSLGSSSFGQKSPVFIGAGAQLFAAQNTEDAAGTAEVDHDGPHFEPVIPLPDKIEVKTGEEDEEVMFSHRAKLYRYVGDDKQWKERGAGDIRLLRNRQSGKMRVLMRRDQVLKICANHQITIDMKLQPNAGSDRSWVWSTLADFSEQECKAEQLAVRFKSEDIARQFKEKFEECQELLKNQTPVKTLQKEQAQEEGKDDLVINFKAAEGSWECDICMVRNDCDKVECAACGGLKPGAEPRQDQHKDTKTFLFGSTAPSSGSVFSFGSASQCASAGFSFGSAGRSQGDERFSSFGSFGEAQHSKTGIPIRFGSFGQEEHVTEQQTEDDKETDLPTVKETHRKEVPDKKYAQAQKVQDVEKFEECQELLKTQTQVKILQKEQAQEVKGGLVTKFKAAEGSWKCDICMVRNDSDKVECAACRSLNAACRSLSLGFSTPSSSFNQTPSSDAGFSFGSTDTSQGDAKPIFPYGLFSQTSISSSGVPFSFGSYRHGGHMSEHTEEKKKVFFDHTPSFVGGCSDSSPKTSQIDEKPILAFGSFSETPNLSGGGNASEQIMANKKVPYRSGTLSTKAMTFSSATPISFGSTTSPAGARYSFGSTTSSAATGVSFGSTISSDEAGFSFATVSSAGAGLSFGSTTTSAGTGFSFGSTPLSAGVGVNSLGSTTSSAIAGFSFSSTTSSAGAGLLFGSTASSARAGFSFSSTSSSAGAGLSFESTTSPPAAGLTFRSTTSPLGAGISVVSTLSPPRSGISFGSTTSSALAGFSFSSTSSSAGAGLSFGSTTSSAGTRVSFGSTPPSAGAGLSFVSTTSPSAAGLSFGSTTSPVRAGVSLTSTSPAGAGVLFPTSTPSTEPASSFASTTPSTR